MKMKKKWAVLTAAMLAVGGVLSGCETTGQSAGLGAGIGALGGAIIGAQSGHAVEGALIGAAVGAATGAIVGKIKESREIRNAQATRDYYEWSSADGMQLNVEEATLAPSQVEAGDSVVGRMSYAAVGTPAGGIDVNRQYTLTTPAGEVYDVGGKLERRTDGTYDGEVEIPMAEDAPLGSYKLTQAVSAGEKSAAANSYFSVTQDTAGNRIIHVLPDPHYAAAY